MIAGVPWWIELPVGVAMMVIGMCGLATIAVDWIFGLIDRYTRWRYELLDEAVADQDLEDALIEPSYLTNALWLERGYWIDR